MTLHLRPFWLVLSLAVLGFTSTTCLAVEVRDDRPQLEAPPPHAALERILDSPALSDERRRELQIFHGRWDDLAPAPAPGSPAPGSSAPGSPAPGSADVRERARLAWGAYRLSDAALEAGEVDVPLRAEVLLFRGEAERALALLGDAEGGDIPALYLKASALEDLGRLDEAVQVLSPLRTRMQHTTLEGAAELTAAARALVMLAHLEGRPAQDYRLALSLLGKATQEVDPLYWPAHVAEAELLMTKDNRGEAAEALEQVLALNPKAGMAWFLLGRLAVDAYNFDAAADASARLRHVNPLHPLADELDARSFLRQRDVASARRVLEPALDALPRRRPLLALAAATEAMAYNDDALAEALGRFDEVAPGSPLALFTAGEYLATDRQYGPAGDLLRAAIERSPNWPAPRLELGLMLMQLGDLDAARAELAAAARLDPFHARVNNQLRLAENLLGHYETIETEHFIIRYAPGIDEVLARDMPGPLEEMYDEITAVFRHRPGRKTQIDLMPDKSAFAVRITGMPHIWTIAAATGDVISLTPPRSGPDQGDPYNWVNVLRHEYVHTVTLAQTRNRVPHWFTEACAVSVETTGRTYDTCQLLAWAVKNDELFDYDRINWGFVRPRTERDRPLAYAQSDWMLEYIATAWSHDAIVELLELYRQGITDTDALQQVTGLTASQFMKGFRAYAAEQVAAWGLAEVETSERAREVIADGGQEVSVDELVALLDEHGGRHPELLRLLAERFATNIDTERARHWLSRYAEARPVDPWPHKVMVRMAFDAEQPELAIGSLQELERTENYSSAWSRQLAEVHRRAGRYDAAARAATRALHCEPYSAELRELAATVALQAGDFASAAYQVEALRMLEPDRATHPTRLAVIYERLGRVEDAQAAALAARELDPRANVGRILGE